MALLFTPHTADLWTTPQNLNAGSETVAPVLATSGIPCDYQAVSSSTYLRPDLDVTGELRRLYLPDTLTSIDADQTLFWFVEDESAWKPVAPAEPFGLGTRLGHWTVIVMKADHATLTEHYT